VYDTNYAPFGPSYNESGSEEFKYTGKQEGSSGLYYYGARYYDPTTGRFISEDSNKGFLENPQSLNKYVYCYNNPIKNIDPDGNVVLEAIAYLIIYVGGGMMIAETWYFTCTYITGETPETDELVAAWTRGGVTGLSALTYPEASSFLLSNTPLAPTEINMLWNALTTSTGYSITRPILDEPWLWDEYLGTLSVEMGIGSGISYKLGELSFLEYTFFSEGYSSLTFAFWNELTSNYGDSTMEERFHQTNEPFYMYSGSQVDESDSSTYTPTLFSGGDVFTRE